MKHDFNIIILWNEYLSTAGRITPENYSTLYYAVKVS